MDIPIDITNAIIENEKNVLKCRECGCESFFDSQETSFIGDVVNNEIKDLSIEVYFCKNCGMPLAKIKLENIDAEKIEVSEGGKKEEEFYPFFPYVEEMEFEIDDYYKKYYKEALRLKDINPRACICLLRVLAERLLIREFGVEGNTLGDLINDFKSKWKINKSLSNTLNNCMNLGNSAAHGNSEEITIIDVFSMNEHIKTIFEEILVKESYEYKM
ncbi:MAG: DUF4145 domain-containing protein [Abditibacteriota bacterium]|nr:DUF4145 domain-containing protein [Abditibacteriota bacterium]